MSPLFIAMMILFFFEGSAMGEGIFLSLKKGKNRACGPSESPVIPSKLLV